MVHSHVNTAKEIMLKATMRLLKPIAYNVYIENAVFTIKRKATSQGAHPLFVKRL